jgi:tight adherence protein C
MNHTDFSGPGAVLGLAVGVGVLLIVGHLNRRRRPTLDQRLAPYLRGIRSGNGSARFAPRSSRSRGGRDDLGTPTSPALVGQLLGPFMAAPTRWVERITGGRGQLVLRLDQLGAAATVEQFRAEQVLCGAVGAAAGAGIGLLTLLGGGFSAVPVVGLVVVGGLLGVLGRDQVLSLQVRRRQARIMTEFPAVAELLALSVAAGEGAMGALDRVARTGRGELSAELRRTLADARTGMSTVEALEGLAARSTLPSLARFVDGVVVALDRGTPLAEVLRAQAQDVRDLSRRELMEAGGRREVAMMLPVVFLILPVTVLFAIYPGLAVLDLNL